MNSAYLEIGNKCFCKCIMCDAWKQKRKEVKLQIIYDRILKLKLLNFEQIRLAGNDPLSHPYFSEIIDYLHYLKMHSDVTTTLLGGSIIKLVSVDTLRVSLLAVYDKYEDFFKVNKFDLFCSNLKWLQYKRWLPIIINYTFVNSNGKCNFSDSDATALNIFITEIGTEAAIHFFPAIYIKWRQDDRNQIHKFLDKLNFKFTFFGFDLKVMSSCTVSKKRLYVQNNGDCYPCCMAGGEIGQNKIEELYLGNIDDNTLKQKDLKNLNNYICNHCTQKYYKLMEAQNGQKVKGLD